MNEIVQVLLQLLRASSVIECEALRSSLRNCAFFDTGRSHRGATEVLVLFLEACLALTSFVAATVAAANYSVSAAPKDLQSDLSVTPLAVAPLISAGRSLSSSPINTVEPDQGQGQP